MLSVIPIFTFGTTVVYAESPREQCESKCVVKEADAAGVEHDVIDPDCLRCVCSGDAWTETGHVWTEIGCITPTQKGVVLAVMRIFIGVITGVAVIRFIQAGFMLNTDDVEKIKEAKGIATDAIIALIVGAMIPIILNFVGLDILGIGKIVNII